MHKYLTTYIHTYTQDTDHGEQVVLLYDGQHAVGVSSQRGQQVVAVVHRFIRAGNFLPSQNNPLHYHTYIH